MSRGSTDGLAFGANLPAYRGPVGGPAGLHRQHPPAGRTIRDMQGAGGSGPAELDLSRSHIFAHSLAVSARPAPSACSVLLLAHMRHTGPVNGAGGASQWLEAALRD